MLVGLLVLTANGNAQSVTASGGMPSRTLGVFEISLTPYWTLESAQADRLLLNAQSDSAGSTLAIETAGVAGMPPASAVLGYLCRLTARGNGRCPANAATRWQLIRGKTIRGDDAWLGQQKRVVAGQAMQLVSVVIVSNARLLAFNLSSERRDATKTDRFAAQQALGALIQTLSISGQATPSSDRWSIPDEPLTGFFATIGGSKSQTSFSAHRHVMGVSGLRLASSGWFALSARHLDQAIQRQCETPAQICGRYIADADRITTWRATNDFEERVAFMREQQWTFKREPDGSLLIGGERHLPVSEPSAHALAGRYRSAQRSGTSYEETVFSFFNDGQFEQTGFTATTGKSGAPISLATAPATKAGNFTVDGYTLLLDYRDGRQQKHSLFVLGGAPVIDGSMFQQLREPGVKLDK